MHFKMNADRISYDLFLQSYNNGQFFEILSFLILYIVIYNHNFAYWQNFIKNKKLCVIILLKNKSNSNISS